MFTALPCNFDSALRQGCSCKLTLSFCRLFWCSPSIHPDASTAATSKASHYFCKRAVKGDKAHQFQTTSHSTFFGLFLTIYACVPSAHFLEAAALYPASMGCPAGTARYQKAELSCRSFQSQHARLQEEGPDISSLDPLLQKQWHHAANSHLGNITIKSKSNKKVGWICDQCPDGHLHSWSAKVKNRTNGNGCPQCSGFKVCKHNCLATKDPKVAAQWDYAANEGTPDSVVAQSSKPAGWHCTACGHKWSQTPNARLGKNRRGCPQCAAEARNKQKNAKHPTFAECNHSLLAEWDHDRNATEGNFPDKVTLGSQKQIFWLCNKCPAGQEHSWTARPASRTGRGKSGCPCCAGHVACKCNSLQLLCPAAAAEWDHSKNRSQPSDHTAGSRYVAWWFTPQRGSWQQPIHVRTKHVVRVHRTSSRRLPGQGESQSC